MSKKTLGEELSDVGAEFIILFIGLGVLLSPIIIGGTIGVIIAIILIVGIVILYTSAAIITRKEKRERKKNSLNKNTNIQINPTHNMVKSTNLERRWRHCPYCGVKIPATIKTCYYCKNKGKNK